MNDKPESPYKSRPSEGREESTGPQPKSQLWQLVMFAFAVAGYFVALVIRRSLGLSGVIPGGIFGGIGVGCGVAIALLIKAKVSPSSRV
ncbi:MAG: hypothetical protein HQ567_12955 [Candidatus Nealsonbacteria bacterium]|nr:hypothetical protein [Candidatus Nealsonbacteria bacterium]